MAHVLDHIERDRREPLIGTLVCLTRDKILRPHAQNSRPISDPATYRHLPASRRVYPGG